MSSRNVSTQHPVKPDEMRCIPLDGVSPGGCCNALRRQRRVADSPHHYFIFGEKKEHGPHGPSTNKLSHLWFPPMAGSGPTNEDPPAPENGDDVLRCDDCKKTFYLAQGGIKNYEGLIRLPTTFSATMCAEKASQAGLAVARGNHKLPRRTPRVPGRSQSKPERGG